MKFLPSNDLALTIDQELGEIPLNCIEESALPLLLQEFVQRMSIIAIHFDLAVQIRIKLELLLHEILDVHVTSRLLKHLRCENCHKITCAPN